LIFDWELQELVDFMRAKLIFPLLALGALALIWFLPVLMQHRFDATRIPALDSRNPATIDLTVRLEHVGSLTNTEPLMSLLRAGKHVHSHLCVFQGTLSFHFPNGDSNGVAILPGHTNANYEFVCSIGYYAIPRSAFMHTLAQAGAETNLIPTK
jgi:hypothetical protein